MNPTLRPIELEGKQERKGEGIRNYQKPLPYSPRAHKKFVTEQKPLFLSL